MNSLMSKRIYIKKSLLSILFCSSFISSCTSGVDTIIQNARLNYSEFEEILAKSDTIPLYRLNDLDSSFEQVVQTKMSGSEHSVVNNLRDSLVQYRTKNTHNILMLELNEWEKELKNFYSGDAGELIDIEEMKESIADKSQYFINYLNENRDRLSQEEIRRINDIIGKQTAADTKELLKSAENGVNDFLQRIESWSQSIVEELEK